MAALRLFQLPKSAQHKLLANLAVIEIINLSFCSKKSKTFVKNAGLKASQLNINFQNDLCIETSVSRKRLTMSLGFPPRLANNTDGVLDRPCVSHHFEPNLSFIQLVRHYSYIFNANEITKCSISCNDNRYDIESIEKCLKGFTVRTLIVVYHFPQDIFQPVLALGMLPKVLVLFPDAFQDADVFRNALASNYVSIKIFYHSSEYFSKLDNILAINGAFIEIKGSTFSDKNLNRFLKVWMKNAMPRLRKLRFRLAGNRVINQDVVLKGIKYTVNPERLERLMWRETEYGRERDEVIGGVQISRIDRINATIILERKIFEFYVWDT